MQRRDSQKQRNPALHTSNTALDRRQSSGEDELVEGDMEDDANQPQFDLQVKIHQLKTQINCINYDKAKMAMVYQENIKELRQHNLYLEDTLQRMSIENRELFENQERLRATLGETKLLNNDLTKQIMDLRTELREIMAENRITPNFNEGDQSGHSDLINIMVQKDSIIARLTRQLKQYRNLQDTFGGDKDNERMRTDIQRLEEEKSRLMKEIDRQTNEQNQKRKDWEKQLLSKDEAIRQLTQHREDGQQSIKLKDKKIEELKKEINQLRAVINAAENDKKLLAEQIEGLTKKSQGYDKLVQQQKRIKEQQIIKEQRLAEAEGLRSQLQTKLGELQIEMSKLKSERDNLEQFNHYLQNTNAENNKKKKELQQELYQTEKELSEQKSLLFNEKIEAKRAISSTKLQYEEQIMRQVEIIEEKTKEISRIKANEPAVMGRNQSEFEQLTAKCRAGTNELEKQVQLSLGLKSENQALRSELQSISNKLARKNQKMLAMEQQIKSESEGRVKRLQKEVYQLQQANEELQARLEQKSLTSKSLRNSPTQLEHLKSIIEVMKIENEQVKAQLSATQVKQKRSEEQKQKLQKKIGNLQSQLKDLKTDYRNLQIVNDEISEKYRNLNSIEVEINRMNEELLREKQHNQRKSKEDSGTVLRLQNRISMLEEDVKRECNRADIANSKLINAESEYMRKINELTRKEEELRKNLIEVNRDQSKQLSPTSLKDKLAKEEETYSQEEELRAKVKKQMELKYSNELAKLQDYVDELEKKCDALEERATNKGASQLSVNGKQLEADYYRLKLDYSQSLQQINVLLLKLHTLEERYQKSQATLEKCYQRGADGEDYKERYLEACRIQKELSLSLDNAYRQIDRLNKVLMEKEQGLAGKSKILTCPHYEPTQKVHNGETVLTFEQTRGHKMAQTSSRIKQQQLSRVHYMRMGTREQQVRGKNKHSNRSPVPIIHKV